MIRELPATVTSDARICACNCPAETKVVPRALPFQFTTAPGTKFAPRTVSVKPALPGATACGMTGPPIVGIGLDFPHNLAAEVNKRNTRREGRQNFMARTPCRKSRRLRFLARQEAKLNRWQTSSRNGAGDYTPECDTSRPDMDEGPTFIGTSRDPSTPLRLRFAKSQLRSGRQNYGFSANAQAFPSKCAGNPNPNSFNTVGATSTIAGFSVTIF